MLLSKSKLNYYPDPNSNIRDKTKLILDLSNYETKKELKHATGADTSDLFVKKIFYCVKS